MKEAGFNTVESVLFTPLKNLIIIKGLSDNKIEKIIEAWQSLREWGFQTANEYFQKRKNVVFISTGSSGLGIEILNSVFDFDFLSFGWIKYSLTNSGIDEMLGGGMESGSITEMFGEFRTGKTQMCLTLWVTCQLAIQQGGGAGMAMYIDTEGTFRPERLVEIAKRYELDEEQVLQNVAYARAYTSDQQNKLLVQAAALMWEK